MLILSTRLWETYPPRVQVPRLIGARDCSELQPSFNVNVEAGDPEDISRPTSYTTEGLTIAYDQLDNMAPIAPRFFATPLRYLHWSAVERPAIFWSMIIGSIGPVMLFVVPPIRHRLGDGPRSMIPLTYPIPTTARKQLDGYNDE